MRHGPGPLTLVLVALASEALGGTPRPIHTPAPSYPAWAIGTGVSTEVELCVLIDREGRVRRVDVVPYDVRHDLLTRDLRASFDSAAVRAVRAWRFEPATRNGRPTSAWSILRVPFSDPRDALADSASWSADSTAWNTTAEPIERVAPEWPAAVSFECEGQVTVRIFPGRDGKAWAARIAKTALSCREASLRTAIEDVVIRAARGWRFRPGDHEGEPILVDFRIPSPRLETPAIVGCVRDSITGELRPDAEVLGPEGGHAFGTTDAHGWFVLRGTATRSSRLRARDGACAGGFRAARPWKQRGDEVTLYAGPSGCGKAR